MGKVNKIVCSGTGVQADFLRLGSGKHTLDFTWAGTPGSAALLNRTHDDDGTFRPSHNKDGEVVVDADISHVVTGNQDYTVDVTADTSVLTINAVPVNKT